MTRQRSIRTVKEKRRNLSHPLEVHIMLPVSGLT